MSILCSGSFVADILIPDLHGIGSPGSLTYAPQGIHLSPGGHSSNVAIDLAQLGVENVNAVGAIGEDEMGGVLVEQLRNRGINCIPEVIKESTTAKNVAILVRGEDRRYIAELTANSRLSAKFLTDAISEVKPSTFYQGTLGGLPDIEKYLDEILWVNRGKYVLNFVDVIMPSNGWAYLRAACPFIDIFHANQLEAQSLTGEKDTWEALKVLTRYGIRLAVISDGDKGVVAATDRCIVEMPSYRVTQIDPTGAGDALCAGIIASIRRNKILSESITVPETIVELLLDGQAAGAACVTGLGATTSVSLENAGLIRDQQGEELRNKTTMKTL